MKEAKKKLENEIRKLGRELKAEIPKALKTAAAMGDLSENADYSAAKERQSFLQVRLAQLRERLATLSMVNLSKIPTDKVSYGSKVVLLDLDTDKEVTYKLVSSEESNVKEGLISTASPIGQSLMGREEGDEVQIRTPGGIKNYEIVQFTTLHDG
ncbi:MAG: transcription elongation factor GreA [Acidobacteria bacterium]|nr:MAG: transcription elongation factor GreA [Acidobacteriota bacterium]TDI15283.1 MAG: transcription elongation factor GreA [Acidobacteriota bacterium]